jgi:DNA polymerase-4
VASASYEARAFGVKTAMPLQAAARRCPGAVFLRGSFHHYQEFSERVFDLCGELTPAVQQASLDEAYLDLAGCRRVHGGADPLTLAARLRRRIKHRTGLNVSIGIASNKLVAKIATDYAKPKGICRILPGGEAAFLSPLAVGDLPGVGRRTAEILAGVNLHTVAQLRAVSRRQLGELLGAAGEGLYDRCRGVDVSPVEAGGAAKSISRETTFEQDTVNRRLIRAMLFYLTERACTRLRETGSKARTVAVKIRYADFDTKLRSRTLGEFTDQEEEVYRVVLELFERAYQRRVQLRLVGVHLSGLSSGADRQVNFLTEARHGRRERLHAAVDGLRRRMGFSAVTVGRSIELLETHPADRHGFRLRTSCLSR